LLTGQSAVLVDIALEGTVSGVPKPNISALESVFDKLSDLKVKEAKEQIKARPQGLTLAEVEAEGVQGVGKIIKGVSRQKVKNLLYDLQ
jgi:hypothetical protein